MDLDANTVKDALFLLVIAVALLFIPPINKRLREMYAERGGGLSALYGLAMGVIGLLGILLILYWPLIREVRQWLFH